jgi:non-ribosomal peptide synthetase component F
MGKDPEPVSPLPLQYKDFCQWYYRQLDKTEQEKASHQFWTDKLADGIPILRLPVDSRENREDTRGAAYRCSVNKDLKKRLKKLAAENNTTLSMVMFTIYNILLSHVSGQEDIVCSLISAGRDHLSLGRIVGYFTTSIMVITHVDAEEDFNALLHRVHTDVMETVQHQEYPLESVLDELKMNYPDIAVSFNMFDLPEGSAAEETETFEPYHMDKVQGVKFDLALFLTEYKDSIELLWNYKKALFNPHTIESFVRIYFDLLSELSDNEN